MFTPASFTTADGWKQPKDPPRGQYTNNLHHVLVCTMTHYSDVERDVLIHATVCMNPEGIRSLRE